MPCIDSDDAAPPGWLFELLGVTDPDADDGALCIGGHDYVADGPILRAVREHSAAQSQTADAFGFKWNRRDTFESAASLERMRRWLGERYGEVADAPWWIDYGDGPVVLDAGCGAGMSVLELFGERLSRVRYLGVDVSPAVDVAASRFAERGLAGAFVQADFVTFPIPDGSVDVAFSEGVLHHTDSTRGALERLARAVRPGGRVLFYVYRRKGPIREFTDDYIRDRLAEMSPDDAWKALEPLTKLGVALGELDVEVDVPVDVPLLGIPAGRHDVQRLFYWHVCKLFYHPDLNFDELNHINYDWYAPANAHRQTPEEVREWCVEAGLEIERERIEEAGITVIARRG